MYYRLLEDKYSTVKKKQLYAKKGERVKLIADHQGTLIVEGKSGRFSIPQNQLIK